MAAPEMIDVTVYVLVNSDGEYRASDDPDAVTDAFEDNDFHTGGRAVRRIAGTFKVSVTRNLELSATLPPEDSETGAPITLTVS